MSVAFQEQLPIPCRRCGAPMRPFEGPSIVCDFCGSREPLPPDATARVEALRRRLADLAAAHRGLERASTDLARRFEGQRSQWLTGTLKAALGPLGLIVALVVAPSLMQAGPADPSALIMGVALLLQLALVVAGMASGYAMLSWRYRRTVRPRLLARAPTAPSAPLRCRICGGTLPPATDAFVTCRYCQASNLISAEVERDRTRALHDEAEGYRRRATSARAVAPFEHAQFTASGVLLGNLAGVLLGSALLWSATLWLR